MNQFKKKPSASDYEYYGTHLFEKQFFLQPDFLHFFGEIALVDLDPDGLSATASGGKMNSSSSLSVAFF